MKPKTHLLWASLCLSGCVFPASDPTGLELSWRFAEANEVGGEEAARLRTCAGALVDRVLFAVTDKNDPARTGTFDYPCEDGFQTPEEFSTEASDAFIDLRPGDYEVVAEAFGPIETRPLRSFDIKIQSRSPTPQALDLAFEQVLWSLSVAGTDACSQLALSLHYPDPELDLATPDLDDNDVVIDAPYRAELRSNRGLSLGGADSVCADVSGDHAVEGVDQGRYSLRVTLDGVPCPTDIPVELNSAGGNTVIDLANLDCGG